MSSPVIKGVDLRVWFSVRTGFFKRGYVKAVDGVDIEIYSKETFALVGESGCGKTTLGRTLLKLVPLTSGKLIFMGKDITNLSEKELKWFRREAQMIFQDPYSSLPPTMNVYRILEEPVIIHKIGNSKDERVEIIVKALQDVKLQPPEEFMIKYPHQLSGGQRQRVVIARALILKPKFIVADEPVSMIDASSRAEILYLMKELQEKYNIAYLYITHDIATAKYFSDRIAIMYAGKIVEIGSTKSVLSKPLHPYTQALIEAVPDPDPANRVRIRKVPSGEPPNLLNPPSGCRFHPRCPYANEKCKKEEPKLKEVESKHYVACWLY